MGYSMDNILIKYGDILYDFYHSKLHYLWIKVKLRRICYHIEDIIFSEFIDIFEEME